MDKRTASEACYWQARARFWHRAADHIAEGLPTARQAHQPELVRAWTATKNAERSAGIVARRIMGLG